MIRKLAILSFSILVLGLSGCVIYDPYYGYHGRPYYHHAPPIEFRFHYYHRWHRMNQDFNMIDPTLFVEYWDDPLMCVNPEYLEQVGG